MKIGMAPENARYLPDDARRFAILHTVIVNCDLVGAPPLEYLRDVLRHL